MRSLVLVTLLLALACPLLVQEEAPKPQEPEKKKPQAKEEPSAKKEKQAQEKEITAEEIAAAIGNLTSRFSEERKEARRKLLAAGKRAVKPLTGVLKDELPARRATAADILGFIGEESTAPALLELVKDGDITVRETARKAFIRLGPSSDKHLLSALRDWSEEDRKALVPVIRWRVTTTIKNLVGPDGDCGDYPGQFDSLKPLGKFVTPELLKIAGTPGTMSYRFLAVTALGHLGDKSAVPELKKMYEKESKINDLEPNLRDEVVVSLAQLGDDSFVKKVIEHYQVKFINEEKNRYLYTIRLALFYHKLEKWKEAEEHYKRAIEIGPDNPNAYFNYACLLSYTNRTGEALKALKTSIEKGYNDAAWMMRDGELANVRKLPEFKQLYDKHFGKQAGSE
jgi:HEAT repeat protein